MDEEEKGTKIVYCEKKIFVQGRLEQSRLYKNLVYWHDVPNEPTKEGPCPGVPFALV
jgi:hypothetical protein